jgi:hypothetical protein
MSRDSSYFLAMKRWVAKMVEKKFQLLGECLANLRLKPRIIFIGAFCEAQFHLRFLVVLLWTAAFRSSAAIAFSADL